MVIFFVIILALVQGLTEFLPVSSSGHLVLLNKFFGIENDFLLLSVILHVATLFSVLIVLRKEVAEIIKHPFGELSRKLILSTIPTVIIVLLFKGFIDKSFDGGLLPICFMFTAVLLVVSEIVSKKANIDKPISKKMAIFMGIAQGVAVLPGISRSGATICTGLLQNGNREQVTHFSFLMSVPIIVASLVLEIFEYVSAGQALTIAWYELAVGFVVAFITGIFAIKFMLNVVKKHSLIWFAIYLFVIAIISFFV